jgi:hypothetical protein
LTYIGDYTGTTAANYIGTLTYIGDYTGTTAANYTGPTPVNYVGTLTYLGDYLGVTPINYIGVTPAVYTGTLAYLGDYLGITGNLFAGPFPTIYVTSYDGPAYTTTYTSVVADTLTYIGLTPSNYAGAINYSSTYGGSIINNDSSTIATRTLWRRIA